MSLKEQSPKTIMSRNDIIDTVTLKIIKGNKKEVKESVKRLYNSGCINGKQLSHCVGSLITL